MYTPSRNSKQAAIIFYKPQSLLLISTLDDALSLDLVEIYSWYVVTFLALEGALSPCLLLQICNCSGWTAGVPKKGTAFP